MVERRRAEQADLLLRREEQLDARVRTVLARRSAAAASSIAATAALLSAPRIVPPALRTTPSSTTGSIGPSRRHRVEVRAEEDRHAAARRRPGSRQSRFPAVAADPGAGVVLVDLEPERRRGSAMTRSATARSSPGRARDRGELEEELEDVRRSAAA